MTVRPEVQLPPTPASLRFENAVCSDGGDGLVGQIVRPIIIRNLVDLANVEAGLISAGEARSITLDRILLDTGATHLCLPQDLIDALGLRKSREVLVETATTATFVGLFQGAELEVSGRTCGADVIALPIGRPALFGVLAMEALGMTLNLVDQTIDFLPNYGIENYIRA